MISLIFTNKKNQINVEDENTINQVETSSMTISIKLNTSALPLVMSLCHLITHSSVSGQMTPPVSGKNFLVFKALVAVWVGAHH